MKIKRVVTAFCTVFVCLSMASFGFSQPIWPYQQSPKSITFEFLKPDRETTTTISSVIFVSVRWPILFQNIVFVGELPFTHIETDFDFGFNRSNNRVGNPYLGIEFFKKDSPLFFEGGIRLPFMTSGDLASTFGQLTDVDRLEAFSPDIFTLLGTVNFQTLSNSNIFIRLRVGPSIMVSTGEGEFSLLSRGDDSELYLLYSGQVGLDLERVHLGAGLTGRLLTTEDGNFGERTFMQLGLIARLKLGRVHPGVHFRFPLEDDLKEVLDFVGGFNLAVDLAR